MEESTSREKVLKKVRNALIYKSDNPFPHVDFDSPIYKELSETPDVNFAMEFTKVGGKFVYCESEEELISSLAALFRNSGWTNVHCFDPELQYLLTQSEVPFLSAEDSIPEMKVSVTGCEFLMARLGSIMVSSRSESGRRLHVFPEVHVVVAYTWQLVPDLKEALSAMKEKYGTQIPSMISVITGPSRTADIEKTLVMGAHGPRELFVILVEQENPGKEEEL